MNIRQRLYDSKDSSNQRIKITNSSVLSKNLEEIRNRKPIYINNSLFKSKKSKSKLNDYYRNKENKIINKIIDEIRFKEVKPIVNTEQNQLINNSMRSRKKHYKLNNLALEKENENFKRRLNNQKAFISAKILDEEYKNMMRKNSAKKKANLSLILPPINSYK